LILLDVRVPELGGFETASLLLSDPSTSGIPIVFLSASIALEQQVRGLELGALDYVTKPFDMTEMRALIVRVLESTERGHLSHRQQRIAELRARLAQLHAQLRLLDGFVDRRDAGAGHS
jgi:DNA-binding response OmpR family regulator